MHLLHSFDAHFELALIAHRHLGSRLDAPRLGVTRGVYEPGDARGDKMFVLVGLQHVECLFVSEGGMVDVLDAVPDALLDRSGRAGMRGQNFVPALRLLHGHRHLFFRHRGLFRPHASDLLAGEVELDGIDAVFDKLAHGAAHFLRP